VGYLPKEQVLAQWLEVNLRLWLDLAPASQRDRLEDTLDYRNTIATVKHRVNTANFALIERLAEAIARLRRRAEWGKQVKIRVTKPYAPILDFGGKIKHENHSTQIRLGAIAM
jgi:dihydroneopterin aldolase